MSRASEPSPRSRSSAEPEGEVVIVNGTGIPPFGEDAATPVLLFDVEAIDAKMLAEDKRERQPAQGRIRDPSTEGNPGRLTTAAGEPGGIPR